MIQTVLLASFFAIITGLLIELFFRLIKYRDELNKEGPRPITAYGTITDASNYMSVSQYLSGGERRWTNYFLFRLLPPTILLILLAGVIVRYLNITNSLSYLLLATVVSLIPRDIVNFFTTNRVSERLLHVANIMLVLALTPLVWFLGKIVDLSTIAPSAQGLIDNLWSSLLIAILVLLYLKMTNMSAHYQDQVAEDTALSNYVIKAYTHIFSKYDVVIQKSCSKYACSPQILYAVLIYEDMNRPASLRRLENWLVRIFHLNLTVGIAQVRSNKPLTDEESIRRATKILSGSMYADSGMGDGFTDIQQLEDILRGYNSNNLYAKSVSQIISKLRLYASEIFLKGQTK